MTTPSTRAPRSLRIAALAACLCAPVALRAQVTATLVVPNPTPYLAQWSTDPTVALLTLTNGTQVDLPATSVARIYRGQALLAQVPGLITTIPGMPATSIYRTPQIARWQAASFGSGAPASLRASGVLPDGSYTLCVEVAPAQGLPATNACAPFTLSLAQPPRLVAPLDRSVVTTRFPVLQWAPALSARVPSVLYTVRVVELYGGQTPTRAVEANRPVLEAIVRDATTLQYPLAAWPLLPGRCYAWRVQARADATGQGATAGAPIGRNEGRSELFTFCYRPPADRLDSLRQRTDTSARDTLARDSLGTPPGARARQAGFRLDALPGGWQADSTAAAGGFSGSATAYGEAYDHTGDGPAARPGSTGRMRLTGTATGGGWSAPLEMLVASDERSNRQRITQLRVSPTWRALTVHAGTLVPQLSEYTLYDATLLGGGAELRPAGPLRMSAWFGESQRAVRPTEPTLTPQFARTLGAASAGVGADERANVRADVLFASDPRRNVVVGLRGQLPLWRERVLASAAASRSLYRRDVRAAESDDIADDAGQLSLAWRMPTWSLGTTVAYVGANYVSLGNTQLVTDRVDYQLSGAFQRARFNGTATAGLRRNNVDDALDATTRTRGIYSFTLGWTPSTAWGVDATVSNTMIDAVGRDTTFSRNGTTVFTLAPRLAWRRFGATQQLVLSGAYQRSDNEALVDPQPADVTATTGTLSYVMTFDAGLGLDLSGSTSRTDVAGLTTTVDALTPGIGYVLRLPGFPRPLQTRAAVQWTSAKGSGDTQRELLPVLQLGYALVPGHTIALDVRRRSFRPRGVSGTSGRFDETTAVVEYTRPF